MRKDAAVSTSVRQVLSLLCLSGFVFFLNLGVPALWDEDEPKNGACAREMIERSDWVVPMFNYELRTAKPVLLYWFIMSAYQVFGVNEFGARFWSAVFGVATVLLTYGIGRKLYSGPAGWWAGIVLTAALMFGVSSRAATPDATLIIWTTLSLALFVWGLPSGEQETARLQSATTPTGRLRAWLPNSWGVMIAVYAAMALAVLAKGPVGIALPTLILMLYVGCRWVVDVGERSPAPVWRRVFAACSPLSVWRIGWVLRPLTAVVCLCAIALPWYIWVGLRTDGEWIAGFLGKHNVNRFTQPLEGHSGPIYYYIVSLFPGLFPWSICLPLALVQLVQRLRQPGTTCRGDLFVACWAGCIIGFFSLASTKLPSYILTAYPAVALLIGRCIAGWLAAPALAPRKTLRWAFPVLALTGVIFVAGVPLATARFLPGEWEIGWAGAILVICGLIGWRWFEQGRDARAAGAFATAGVTFAAALFGIVAVQINPHQTSPSFLTEIRGLNRSAQVATFDYFEPSVAYYAQQPVHKLKTAQDAAAFLESHPTGFLLMNDRSWDEMQPHLPSGVKVLSERQRFLKKDRILLLGRTGTTAPETLAKR